MQGIVCRALTVTHNSFFVKNPTNLDHIKFRVLKLFQLLHASWRNRLLSCDHRVPSSNPMRGNHVFNFWLIQMIWAIGCCLYYQLMIWLSQNKEDLSAISTSQICCQYVKWVEVSSDVASTSSQHQDKRVELSSDVADFITISRQNLNGRHNLLPTQGVLISNSSSADHSWNSYCLCRNVYRQP